MKLSVAVSLLASVSTAAAFQAPSSAFLTGRRTATSLHAVAIDPTTATAPPPQRNKELVQEEEEFDMRGIALSVRSSKLETGLESPPIATYGGRRREFHLTSREVVMNMKQSVSYTSHLLHL